MRWEPDGAGRYFDRIPREWDALYARENRILYALNRVLRKDLFQRYRLTFEKCGNIDRATVLDIGCGTGRYSIEFAVRGAARVVGIDFAPSMTAFAEDMAARTGTADKCTFICDDFSNHVFEESFDIVLAIGFFDYVKDPAPVLKKIAAVTRRRFLASFPAGGGIWGLQRRIRYRWIKRCPIYEYDSVRLDALFRDAGFDSLEIEALRNGYFVVASNGTE